MFHGTAVGQTGPLVRRLEGFGKLEGLVVGPWGEGSKDLHSLVKTLAESQVAAKARSMGREASDNELGVVISQVRKYLSTSFIRAQSLCLLNRLGFLGEGAKAAAQQGGGTWPRDWRRGGNVTGRPTIWPTYVGGASPAKDKHLLLSRKVILGWT